MRTPSILVVGSINSDLILRTNCCPEAGETLVGTERQSANGGKGANQAVAAARLGADVTLVGKIGDDLEGHQMMADFRKEGIDTELIVCDTCTPTGLAAVIVESSGQNRIIIYPGANRRITHDMIDRAIKKKHYDAMMLQLEIEPEMSIYAAFQANKAGIPVILDPAPAQQFDLKRLGKIFMVTPNETEAQALAGIPICNFEDAAKAAEILYQRAQCTYVVIKMGGKGSLVFDGESCKSYAPFSVATTVDTTAAGDAFNAALVCEYFKTRELNVSVQFASMAGALTVTRPGAQTSLPTREEVLDGLEPGV